MQIVETVRAMTAVRESSTSPVAMMATLGGMHRGHEVLLQHAREIGGTLVASLFLNPSQFDDASDLERYPADRERDLEILQAQGVDIVFAPTVEEMYPADDAMTIDPGPRATVLEGASRPGHFAGVATVVAKLLRVIRPDVAVWGAKDAQQNVIIRWISRELGLEVDHRVVPTVRDADGLALSSRNERLSSQERNAAPVLYSALVRALKLFSDGMTDPTELTAGVRHVVSGEPLVRLEYVSVADPRTLQEVEDAFPGALVSLAALIGDTRLIDNVILGDGPG